MTGVVTDVRRGLGDRATGPARAAVTGGIAAALVTALTFVVGGLETALAWDGELIVSVVLVAGVAGSACAAVTAGRPPARSRDAPTGEGSRV